VGNKALEGLQELVHTLAIGFTAKDLIEEDGLGEKERQLRAKDWDITISEEMVLLETALKKHNQDLERPVGVLSEKLGTMRQLHHAGKVTTADADREVEGLVSQGTESDGKDVAQLRLLVQFLRPNSEKVAIKNRDTRRNPRTEVSRTRWGIR
jgi:hypothetical protein